MNIIYRVVYEIADREGVDPVDLDPPIGKAVDTDVPEALITGAESWADDPPLSVEFEYYGYTVSIDSTGNVDIIDSTETTRDSSGKMLESSLKDISAEMGYRKETLEKIGDIIAARDQPFEKRLEGVLSVVRKTLGVEASSLSYLDVDSYVFESVDTAAPVAIQAGEIVPLAETACKRAIRTEQALVFRDVEVDAPELADSAFGVSSYIGVPVFVDGEVYGTFCFYDREPRDGVFSKWDLALVELLGNWVSTELERRQRERSLHASTSERPSSPSST